MGPGQSRLLIWSVPTVALLLSLLWYKRKSGKRPELQEAIIEPNESPMITEEKPSETQSVPTTPQRSPYCRSLSGIESSPIDIKTNRSPPLIISDRELDMEIEKIKSMKSSSNNASHSSASSTSSASSATSTISVPTIQAPSEGTVNIIDGARDSANHSPAEAMLASPSCSIASDGHHSDSDSGKGGSDVATPPPPPQQTTCANTHTIVHEFVIPQLLVGRLIGRRGAFVHLIKDKTNAHILIKRHPEAVKGMKVCAVEGTRIEIDAALDMIREKFPEKRYPDVVLDHVTFADTTNSVSLIPDCMYLKLVEGINNDTIVSCMVTPRHLFLQQPTHPTFPSLNILSSYMNACYSSDTSVDSPPLLPTPIVENTICAAHSLGAWYRATVVSVDEESSTCYVRFLDYGGFATVDTSSMRQIRGDFLLLPFQAAECLLAGVQPTIGEDEAEVWPQEAYDLVADLTKGAVVFTQVADYMEDGTPLVYIYVRGPDHVVFLNKELVERGLASWSAPDT